jgi:hypothetical protein
MKEPRVAKRRSASKKLRVRQGTLKLKIVGVIGRGVGGFETIGAAGAGFGGSNGLKPRHDTD